MLVLFWSRRSSGLPRDDEPMGIHNPPPSRLSQEGCHTIAEHDNFKIDVQAEDGRWATIPIWVQYNGRDLVAYVVMDDGGMAMLMPQVVEAILHHHETRSDCYLTPSPPPLTECSNSAASSPGERGFYIYIMGRETLDVSREVTLRGVEGVVLQDRNRMSDTQLKYIQFLGGCSFAALISCLTPLRSVLKSPTVSWEFAILATLAVVFLLVSLGISLTCGLHLYIAIEDAKDGEPPNVPCFIRHLLVYALLAFTVFAVLFMIVVLFG